MLCNNQHLLHQHLLHQKHLVIRRQNKYLSTSFSQLKYIKIFYHEFFATINTKRSIKTSTTSFSQLSISSSSKSSYMTSTYLFNNMNFQKFRFCSASSFDVKNAEIERYYMSEIDLFSSDLSINEKTSTDDFIHFRNYRVFRNVRLFIQRIKQVETRNDVSIQ